MTTISKPMSATDLILCLSGELEIDPGLIVETIKGESELMQLIRSYGANELTYQDVLDTLSNHF
jgi:hypothetical protein